MRLDYTEFSFGYAFTENLIRSASTAPGGAPFFPNLIQEGQLGYDVHIDLPGCPLYLQYKLPDLMVRDTAVEVSRYSLPGIAAPFFRMHLMTRAVSRQHELLMCLENRHPNAVYYATPALRSNQSFNAAYNSATVHLRSVLFSPRDIGPLPDDHPHVVSYRNGLSYAWFCSEPQEIRAFKFEDLAGQLGDLLEEPRYRTLRTVARTTLEELLPIVPHIRDSENAIRQRIRERRTTLADRAEISDATMGVAEDLLMAREIARVALGLELVIAQRSR